MAEIKTRNVTRGTIKTLDRAASSIHHLKEETIRSKTADIRNEYGSESVGSYAQDTAVRYAGNGTAYAARAGLEMMLKSREKSAHVAKPLTDSGESDFYDSHSQRIIGSSTSDSEKRSRQAFREHGIKTIRDRQNRTKMADADKVPSWNSRGNTARNRCKQLKRGDLLQRRRKEYAVKRITERNAKRETVWQSVAGGRGSHPDKALKGSGRILKRIAGGSRTLLSTISVSGAAMIVIIVIMVLFGAALAMNEDGSYMTGSGDATIVEVARGELGNVGGDKFWKWYGFKNHVHWCACFVSWCADQCGYIETGIIPKFAVVGNGASWFKDRHRWAGRGYKPKPGDIIFFDFEQDGVLDHVGIVESYDGKTVATIEGNSGNVCRRQSYRAGSPQIAGYGLVLIPGGGNKSQMLARKAIQLAYPDSPKEARYHGGKPTPAYAAALKRAYPDRSGWGKPSRDGASCDVFVGVCVVDSGVDKGFPRGYEDQTKRLDSRKDLYDCVVSTTSRNIKESALKEGDIIRYVRNSGGVHIMIYAGGRIRQAAYDNYYPRTNSPDSKLKISGKKLIRVYRVKG